MSSWKVLYSFIEGMKKEKVVWFEDNYNAVLNGTDGHHQHSEVKTHLDTVRRAIELPDQVNKGPRSRCYYAWFAGDRNYPNCHMKVVIRRMIYGKLKVVTAYFAKGFGTGETIIWSKT